MNTGTEIGGSCECGAAQFQLHGSALMRVFCHCTICQAFNESDYADITLYRSKDVTLSDPATVELKTYKKTPPAVQRGKCTTCRKPAIEYFDMPLMPGVTIIPSVNMVKEVELPEPLMHIFYHSRVRDIEDDLPKYQGFVKSQLCFVKELLSGIRRIR